MWKEFVEGLTKNTPYVNIGAPASKDDISLVEEKLGVVLPQDLVMLLLEMNGDGFFLMSTEGIIEANLSLRALDCYMPLDCLVLFANNGCGDYFGYPIRKDGLDKDNVFMWDHESDNRVWRASGLKDVITKYYSGKI